MKNHFGKILLVVMAVFLQANVAAEENASGWEHRMTPYLWLPTIDGSIKYDLPSGGGGSPKVEIGPADWLDLLNFGILLNGSSRKDKFSINYDALYLSLTSKNDGRVVSVDSDVTGPGGQVTIPVNASLNADTRTDLDGALFTLTGGYTYNKTESAAHDFYAGIRYFNLDAKTRWDLSAAVTLPGGAGVALPAQGSIGADKDLVDGVIGLRGRYSLGQGNWSMPYAIDVGAGSSNLTWNALIGLEYQYGWGQLVFAYRHLAYDLDDDNLFQDLSLSGPAFGASFKF